MIDWSEFGTMRAAWTVEERWEEREVVECLWTRSSGARPQQPLHVMLVRCDRKIGVKILTLDVAHPSYHPIFL